MAHRMISPDQAIEEAKRLMLDGRDPETSEDWALIVNCLAVNIAGGVAESACLLMRAIYQMPLSEQEVKEIVAFQLANKN